MENLKTDMFSSDDEYIIIDDVRLPFFITLGWYANNSINLLQKCKLKHDRITLAHEMIKIHSDEITYYKLLAKKTNDDEKKYDYQICIDVNIEAQRVYEYYVKHI